MNMQDNASDRVLSVLDRLIFQNGCRTGTFTGPSLDSPLNLASTARSSAGASSAHRTRRGASAIRDATMTCAVAIKALNWRRAHRLRRMQRSQTDGQMSHGQALADHGAVHPNQIEHLRSAHRRTHSPEPPAVCGRGAAPISCSRPSRYTTLLEWVVSHEALHSPPLMPTAPASAMHGRHDIASSSDCWTAQSSGWRARSLMAAVIKECIPQKILHKHQQQAATARRLESRTAHRSACTTAATR